MLDIGWSELLLVGVLALLVVGPRELPRLLRTVGRWAGKARGLAREFQRTMDDVAREADLKELADAKAVMDDVRKVSRISATDPMGLARDAAKAAVADTVGEAGIGQAAAAPSPAPVAPPAPGPEPPPSTAARAG